MLLRRTVALVACTLMPLAVARNAHAGATLMTGLGGPVGYGTSCMPPNDDGSYPLAGSPGLDITPAFPHGLHFYAGTYTTAWINNNGNMSFNGALSTYTPSAFPGAPEPMIAPYWADVDTRTTTECGDGSYGDGQSYPASDTCTSGVDYSSAPSTDGVWWSMTPGQMVVTWDQVGFYGCHQTPVMTFQMILSSTACGGGDAGAEGANFDIEFRYNTCGWEAGDASGGTNGFCPNPIGGCVPAQAGFDSAQMPDTNYASLPMSRENGIGNELCTGSNLSPPQAGVWQFLVRGGQILCPMAGQPCTTALKGICAAGQLTCGVNGMTTCEGLVSPQPMQCNGLDNNCDGIIDTGPCPPGTSCDGTSCVPDCIEGGCPTGYSCSQGGLCVPTDCLGITCTAGEVCVNGKCQDPCTGVTCPIGEVCRVGNCVDPCAGLNCGMGQVCENGMCVPSCPCTACTSSQTCITTGANAGKCIATDCATVTCQAGFTCQSGACVNDCTGAVCPGTQVCQSGKCVTNPDARDGGTDGGSQGKLGNPDAGIVTGKHDGGVGGDGGGAEGGFNFEQFASPTGCKCRMALGTVAGDRGGASALGAGLGVLAVVFRRRRRRPSASRTRTLP